MQMISQPDRADESTRLFHHEWQEFGSDGLKGKQIYLKVSKDLFSRTLRFESWLTYYEIHSEVSTQANQYETRVVLRDAEPSHRGETTHRRIVVPTERVVQDTCLLPDLVMTLLIYVWQDIGPESPSIRDAREFISLCTYVFESGVVPIAHHEGSRALRRLAERLGLPQESDELLRRHEYLGEFEGHARTIPRDVWYEMTRGQPYPDSTIELAREKAKKLLYDSFPQMDVDGYVDVPSKKMSNLSYRLGVTTDKIFVRCDATEQSPIFGWLCLEVNNVSSSAGQIPLADRTLQRILLLKSDETKVWKTAYYHADRTGYNETLVSHFGGRFWGRGSLDFHGIVEFVTPGGNVHARSQEFIDAQHDAAIRRAMIPPQGYRCVVDTDSVVDVRGQKLTLSKEVKDNLSLKDTMMKVFTDLTAKAFGISPSDLTGNSTSVGVTEP